MKASGENQLFGRRMAGAYLFVMCAFFAIGMRLWFLQGMKGSYFRDLSENNRTRTVRTLPPRGNILDREGRILVKNRAAFDIALMLEDVPNIDQTLATLGEIIKTDPEELKKQLKDGKARAPFQPKVVLHDASRELLAKVKANTYRLPGVIVQTVPTRMYPHQKLAAQVLGYTREISRAQLSTEWGSRFKQGDIVGQSGLEKTLEPHLHGKSGFVQVEVDAMGNRKRELGIVSDVAGNDITLTIDLDLQLAAEQALEGKQGSVVAIDTRTGEVLALVSAPSFDANVFSGPMLLEDWNAISANPDKPLTNRALSHRYPPGSTFKLIAGLAGLADGVINANTPNSCPGYFYFGKRRYRCHKRTGHGTVSLKQAVAGSCNAYFYQLGQRLGIERLEYYGKLFGLGAATGLEIGGEEKGILPSPEWKLKHHGERWYPGDTIPVSIGQGYLSVTPIQMAVATAAIANDGTVFKPYLVKEAVDPVTGELVKTQPTVINRIEVDKKHFQTIREAAAEVVNGEHGTGKKAKIDPVLAGGKTGTAQVSSLGTQHLGTKFQDHAWFVSFAPADAPTIAMAIVVEHAGGGGANAAPISRNVMKVYFEKQGIDIEETEEEKKLLELAAELQALPQQDEIVGAGEEPTAEQADIAPATENQ